MNFFLFIIAFLGLAVAIGEAFFLFKLKTEPIFFCIKVCPLYCSPRHKRYVDYVDYEDSPPPWHDGPDDLDWPGPYYGRYFFCKPHRTTTTTTTTTMKPKSDEETTYICDLCKEKCNYPRG
ncbi:uncharacterized protein LOC126373901 [Pectinophora gossypiella]|uniref:uncharacterized protein LOC126373901 n=1 Tax=Pectinophora gossypiella TaxID=13191 RepID=UPI00214F43DC|nr:uncharacterized protein LOC126373901 [Pectinophora gossypiella]